MKKCISLLLSFAMLFSLSATVFAAEPEEVNLGNVTVVSPEFPSAYIVTEKVEQQPRTNAAPEEFTVTATVYIEDKYEYDADGNRVLVDSRLLSKEEVDEIGEENFGSSMPSTRGNLPGETNDDHRKFTLKCTASQTANSYTAGGKNVLTLVGDADWDGFDTWYDSEENPAVGVDYIGYAWSGGFSCTYSMCQGTYSFWGNNVDPILSDSVPQAGRVWSFDEYISTGNAFYAEHLDCNATLIKNSMDGGGNYAEAVLKYIHTYQRASGNISISASEDGIGAGFTLQSVSDQWSVVCTITGIYY